jgi:hypothetical protein
MSQTKSGNWASFSSKGAALAVEDAIFFPEDFRKLHRRHVIYIKRGAIIDLDKLRGDDRGPLPLVVKRAYRHRRQVRR